MRPIGNKLYNSNRRSNRREKRVNRKKKERRREKRGKREYDEIDNNNCVQRDENETRVANKRAKNKVKCEDGEKVEWEKMERIRGQRGK